MDGSCNKYKKSCQKIWKHKHDGGIARACLDTFSTIQMQTPCSVGVNISSSAVLRRYLGGSGFRHSLRLAFRDITLTNKRGPYVERVFFDKLFKTSSTDWQTMLSPNACGKYKRFSKLLLGIRFPISPLQVRISNQILRWVDLPR